MKRDYNFEETKIYIMENIDSESEKWDSDSEKARKRDREKERKRESANIFKVLLFSPSSSFCSFRSFDFYLGTLFSS